MNEPKNTEYIKYPVSFHRFKLHLFIVCVLCISLMGSIYAFETWDVRLVFFLIFIFLILFFCVDLAQNECSEEKAAERLSVWLTNTETGVEEKRQKKLEPNHEKSAQPETTS